jgi:hypothetical protein
MAVSSATSGVNRNPASLNELGNQRRQGAEALATPSAPQADVQASPETASVAETKVVLHSNTFGSRPSAISAYSSMMTGFQAISSLSTEA